VQSPEMAIVEGQFNSIGGKITIKVDKKSGDKGNLLENVIVFLTENNKNNTVIKAKTGELVSNKKSNTLQLILHDGNYYQDVRTKDPKKRKKRPHAKSYFKKYTKNFDLSKLNNTQKVEDVVTYRMLKINELIPTIDSLEQKILSENSKDITNLYNGHGLHNNKKKKITKVLKIDSSSANKKIFANKIADKDRLIKNIEPKKDTIPIFKGRLIELFNNKEKKDIYQLAINNSTSSYTQIENREFLLNFKIATLNQHKIALHKKFALAFSCFILFFVGAPLGAIIRKGGMGLPMVLAILLFLTYYFIGIFAENSAETQAIPTILGAWLSTIVILPLGIILTRNATSDKGIFNTDGITVFFSTIWNKISKNKKGDSNLT